MTTQASDVKAPRSFSVRISVTANRPQARSRNSGNRASVLAVT
ncbi:hypothetical protein [Thiocystis minor]|nr:hypothetical protein [Thiocystis minor]